MVKMPGPVTVLRGRSPKVPLGGETGGYRENRTELPAADQRPAEAMIQELPAFSERQIIKRRREVCITSIQSTRAWEVDPNGFASYGVVVLSLSFGSTSGSTLICCAFQSDTVTWTPNAPRSSCAGGPIMSVMFEILDRLEKKDGDGAATFAARAWSSVSNSPVSSSSLRDDEPGSVPNDLSRLSQRAFPLLDIRFGAATRPVLGPRQPTDFPSLWAMARLCQTQSPDARKTARKPPR